MRFGDHGASGGSEEEPFGGAGCASPGTAAFGETDSVVALLGEGSGFGFFVDEVGLGGGQLGLAGLAVEGEVVERFEIGGGDDWGFAGAAFAGEDFAGKGESSGLKA